MHKQKEQKNYIGFCLDTKGVMTDLESSVCRGDLEGYTYILEVISPPTLTPKTVYSIKLK